MSLPDQKPGKPLDQVAPLVTRFLPLHPRKIDLSLGRIERLLEALGRPQDRLPPTIHVAGTNGKGSTIAFMRAMLEASGARVHVHTSPHLVRLNERFRVAGRLAGDALLEDAFQRVEAANGGAPITIFEVITAAAFLIFSETPADYLLLEVGLGGRFDATNVVARPAAAVITPVSLDHFEFLGDTIEKIAGEKAGIVKRGCPAIFSWQKPEALKVLEREAARMDVRPMIAGEDFHIHEENGRLVYQDEKGLLDLPLPRLAGRHQHENAATAIAALRTIRPDLPASAFEGGLTSAEWPARLQRLTSGRLVSLLPGHAEIWLDGGHNEDGARVVAGAMADFEERAARPLILVCGMPRTKDPHVFLKAFRGLTQEVLAVPIEEEGYGRDPADIATIAREEGIEAAHLASVEAAARFLSAREWRVPPRVLITGSLHLAGEVLAANGTPPV